jgi:hypothetical protein
LTFRKHQHQSTLSDPFQPDKSCGRSLITDLWPSKQPQDSLQRSQFVSRASWIQPIPSHRTYALHNIITVVAPCHSISVPNLLSKFTSAFKICTQLAAIFTTRKHSALDFILLQTISKHTKHLEPAFLLFLLTRHVIRRNIESLISITTLTDYIEGSHSSGTCSLHKPSWPETVLFVRVQLTLNFLDRFIRTWLYKTPRKPVQQDSTCSTRTNRQTWWSCE